MHHDSAADRGFDIELKIEEGLYMTKDLFIDFYRYITQGVSSVKITSSWLTNWTPLLGKAVTRLRFRTLNLVEYVEHWGRLTG